MTADDRAGDDRGDDGGAALDLPALVARETAALLGARPGRVGVAVSGGGDSTALLYAAVEAGFEVSAATVDHGLRPESRAEAEGVGRLCTALGVDHSIFFWDGAKARGNVSDGGRRARLALMGDWARERGLDCVLLGHTADDQAETFLMRLSRAAGLEGLSGMRPVFAAEGAVWVRPMLSVGRAALRGWLRAHAIGWVDDPSNENTHYQRVRARKAMAALAPVGVTPEAIGRVVANLARANRTLDALLTDWVAAEAQVDCGAISVPAQAFAARPPELRRRFLSDALVWVARADYPPRAEKLAALLARLETPGGAPRATLHGARIARSAGRIVISREAGAVAGLQAAFRNGAALWDGWRIAPPPGVDAAGLTVSALGAGGAGDHPAPPRHLRAAVAAGPAVRGPDGRVIASLAQGADGWSLLNLRGAFPPDGFSR